MCLEDAIISSDLDLSGRVFIRLYPILVCIWQSNGRGTPAPLELMVLTQSLHLGFLGNQWLHAVLLQPLEFEIPPNSQNMIFGCMPDYYRSTTSIPEANDVLSRTSLVSHLNIFRQHLSGVIDY